MEEKITISINKITEYAENISEKLFILKIITIERVII